MKSLSHTEEKTGVHQMEYRTIEKNGHLKAAKDREQISVSINAASKTLFSVCIYLLLASVLFPFPSQAQGLPFFQNYLREDYHANSMNFDVTTDNKGNVYLANFEGMLYYDNAKWRHLLTPDMTRVTTTVRSDDGTIWVGGYKFFGKVHRKDNGEICLQRVGDADLFNSEVSEIYMRNGKIRFIAREGAIFQVDGDSVSLVKRISQSSAEIGLLDVIDVEAAERGDDDIIKKDEVFEEPLDYGLKAVIKKGVGLSIVNDKHEELYTISSSNGLCSNNIVYISYDGHGTLWGATGKGVFSINIPSAFSRFTSNEGLIGSVFSIETIDNTLYVGTDEGLSRQQGMQFVPVSNINHACWSLTKSGSGLLAATSEGVYRIYPDGSSKQLTIPNSLYVLDNGTNFYCGELDGVYLYSADGSSRKKVCAIEGVSKMIRNYDGTIWMKSIYGMVGIIQPGKDTFNLYNTKEQTESMHSLVSINGKVEVIDPETTNPFPYPLFSYTDDNGVCWLTNNEGKGLYGWKDGKRLSDINLLLTPLNDYIIHAVYRRGDELYIGSNNGLFIVNTKAQEPYLSLKPDLHIRSITLGSDSVLWGGFGDMPEELPTLKYNEHNLAFSFSLSKTPIIGKNLYRYRLNDGRWSSWSTNTEASFINLSHGNYIFHVQARDAMNRMSAIVSIEFQISPPFYLRWYMILFYALILMALIYLLVQARLRKLEKDKELLEVIVKDRTAEVVRLEKMATVGKLTQGLIDRILNPLNYINNFSKLSEGLIKDVKTNIEDEKDNMGQDNYDDTMDVLDMLTSNLQKVSEHGQNTSRTLKAMEEMLKDRSGGIVPMDLVPIIRQDEEMFDAYYMEEIAQYGIKTTFDCPEGPININGNADQLSKTIMSLLRNAVYAVKKKMQQTQFTPEITLKVTVDENQVQVSIRDNGIGIEDSIQHKIFDPFFTTKTTSEASGVGLYLSREIIQNHGGDISVASVKNEYCEFTFNIPVKKS